LRILSTIVLFIPNTQLSCGKEEFSIRTLPTAYDVKEAENTTTTKEEKEEEYQQIANDIYKKDKPIQDMKSIEDMR
jgi:hypothetical protein